MRLIVRKRVRKNLKSKHGVNMSEVEQCFLNRMKSHLEDTRIDHFTVPPTYWFISQTNNQRELKVVFIEHPGNVYEIKTAYTPNPEEKRIYEKYAKPI